MFSAVRCQYDLAIQPNDLYKYPDIEPYACPMAPSHTTTKQLDAVLGYLVGRRLSTREVCAALEMSRSTYYEQRDQGRLITADNLLTAARNLNVNPVDLLVRYGLISASAALEYVEDMSSSLEVMHRPQQRGQTKQAKYDANAPGL